MKPLVRWRIRCDRSEILIILLTFLIKLFLLLSSGIRSKSDEVINKDNLMVNNSHQLNFSSYPYIFMKVLSRLGFLICPTEIQHFSCLHYFHNLSCQCTSCWFCQDVCNAHLSVHPPNGVNHLTVKHLFHVLNDGTEELAIDLFCTFDGVHQGLAVGTDVNLNLESGNHLFQPSKFP